MVSPLLYQDLGEIRIMKRVRFVVMVITYSRPDTEGFMLPEYSGSSEWCDLTKEEAKYLAKQLHSEGKMTRIEKVVTQ